MIADFNTRYRENFLLAAIRKNQPQSHSPLSSPYVCDKFTCKRRRFKGGSGNFRALKYCDYRKIYRSDHQQKNQSSEKIQLQRFLSLFIIKTAKKRNLLHKNLNFDKILGSRLLSTPRMF